jgi:hypothetical protein
MGSLLQETLNSGGIALLSGPKEFGVQHCIIDRTARAANPCASSKAQQNYGYDSAVNSSIHRAHSSDRSSNPAIENMGSNHTTIVRSCYQEFKTPFPSTPSARAPVSPYLCQRLQKIPQLSQTGVSYNAGVVKSLFSTCFPLFSTLHLCNEIVHHIVESNGGRREQCPRFDLKLCIGGEREPCSPDQLAPAGQVTVICLQWLQ